VVARTRTLAYEYNVVMKYLDNLIAWGDSLFMQDTIETINEATLLYVSAANILGPRPQKLPERGKAKAKTFAQLKAAGLDAMGNAMVELEGQFPFNFALPTPQSADSSDHAVTLFGIGRTLYFCIPHNDRLLTYWGHGGGPPVQDPALHEHRGRRAAARAVRSAARPRHAGQGRGGRDHIGSIVSG